MLTEKFAIKKCQLAHLRRKNKFLTDDEEEDNLQKIRKLSGEIKTTDQGFIHLEAEIWKDLDNDERKLIQKYNARVKHNENYKAVKFPEGVTVIHKARRFKEDNELEHHETPTNKENITKRSKKESKTKGIKFNLKDNPED